MSDTERGTTPTPSQLHRGASSETLAARWFALDRDIKRLWQDVAAPPWTGRKLYSTVNRLRWNAFQSPTDIPPPGPYSPTSGLVYGVSAVNDFEGVGVGAYVWSLPASFTIGGIEIALYKPTSGTPGLGGSGAYWNLVGFSLLDGSGIVDFGSLFVDLQRGPDFANWTTPKPTLGQAIRVRFLVCTPTQYPGIPQYFNLTVSP